MFSTVQVYYEAKARKLKENADTNRGGPLNDGYDDQNYDYILQVEEEVLQRYVLKDRIGKVHGHSYLCVSPIYLFVYLSTCVTFLPIYLSIYLSIQRSTVITIFLDSCIY